MIYCFLNFLIAKKVFSQVLVNSEIDEIDSIPVEFEISQILSGSGDGEITYEEEYFATDRNVKRKIYFLILTLRLARRPILDF